MDRTRTIITEGLSLLGTPRERWVKICFDIVFKKATSLRPNFPQAAQRFSIGNNLNSAVAYSSFLISGFELGLLIQYTKGTMKVINLALACLAGIGSVESALVKRQNSANDLTSGSCKEILFIFARGSTEP